MKNLSFYAETPILYKNSIIFTTNNTIYKFNRSKKTLESIFKFEYPIKNIILTNKKLFFKTNFNNLSDIFQIDLTTNQITPLTYLDNPSLTPLNINGNELIYTTNEYNPNHSNEAFFYNLKTKKTTPLHLSKIYAFLKIKEDIIVQKNEYGHLNWKNYQGGLRGKIYKNNKLLIDLPGQSLNPIYVNQNNTERIYFIYNQDQTSALVSCNLNGSDLKYHYKNNDYVISEIHHQNHEIIFSLIGNLFIYNILNEQISQVLITNKLLKNETYQEISIDYLTSLDINKDQIALALRGNIFEKHLYSGGFNQITNNLRFTHTGYVNNILFGFKDGKDTVLYIYKKKNKPTIFKLESQKIIKVQSQTKFIIYSNHKHELRIINIEEGKEKIIDKANSLITYFEISKDQKWIVYEHPTKQQSSIKLYSINEDKIYSLIEDEYHNTHPSFDFFNRYIVFASNRNLKIASDSLKFDYHFLDNSNIFYIPLIPNFNLLEPWKETKEKIIEINPQNFQNISNKITKIDIKGNIETIFTIKDNRLLAIETKEKKQTLIVYNLKTLSQDIIIDECEHISLSSDKQHMALLINDTIKISKAGEKPEETGYKNITIQPNFESIITEQEEIKNIFNELSWLIQEFYWDQNKAKELKTTLEKYENHINRINTKHELYMLLNQMQSEMETSHAYIFSPTHELTKGSLCCEIQYDKKKQHYFVDKILNNYANCEHPIYNYNIPLNKGDIIKRINNIPLSKNYTYNQAILNQANKSINIEIKHQSTTKNKIYNLKLTNVKNEHNLRYLTWVENNTNYIKEKSKNQFGYIHIPDMGNKGFIQFFKSYLNNYNKEALIIDLRYNSGGHISSILIEQLYKKKLGLDIARHHTTETFPTHASNNNYALLINAQTASDGEIFTEAFKQLKLGKVFGERTWGGIVGIWPRNTLIDNLMTSQPEFKMDFFNKPNKDIENYGAIPDIEIEDVWTKKQTPEEDNILNASLDFCIKNYLKN